MKTVLALSDYIPRSENSHIHQQIPLRPCKIKSQSLRQEMPIIRICADINKIETKAKELVKQQTVPGKISKINKYLENY